MPIINLSQYQKKMTDWAIQHYINLAAFNFILVVLVLLRIGNYFDPFWPVTINRIVFLALITSVFLLGVRSRVIFLVALIFWFVSGFMSILTITAWAERISIYSFEAIFLGILLMLVESYPGILNLNKKWKNLNR